MITEIELQSLMEGYKSVEPKSESFERMAETIRVLWTVFRAAEDHAVSCETIEDGFHEAVDAVHARLPSIHLNPGRRETDVAPNE